MQNKQRLYNLYQMGALCIWNQIEEVIQGAGIDSAKVEYTLDYYLPIAIGIEQFKGFE